VQEKAFSLRRNVLGKCDVVNTTRKKGKKDARYNEREKYQYNVASKIEIAHLFMVTAVVLYIV